jgi:L,D-transpeptidase catalytic domain
MAIKNFLLLLFVCLLFGCNGQASQKRKPSVSITKTKAKAMQALAYCKAHKMNTIFCILIDMSIHSGCNRMVVWDFAKNKIIKSILVGHGCGASAWGQDGSKATPVFSNAFDSHCSSLGKYKLGERGYSSWGIKIKYLMHGLESTNNNALQRTVVFHGWDAMPNAEVYPNGSPEGWGCPTISNDNMRAMDAMLQNSNGNVLMWIYE